MSLSGDMPLSFRVMDALECGPRQLYDTGPIDCMLLVRKNRQERTREAVPVQMTLKLLYKITLVLEASEATQRELVAIVGTVSGAPAPPPEFKAQLICS